VPWRRAMRGASRRDGMQYICDAPPHTWFRIDTEGEAAAESKLMDHAVERYFKQAREQAIQAYEPPKALSVIEQNIGLKDHIQRTMPMFVTLRDRDGAPLVTGMLPPKGKDDRIFRPIVVGPKNTDPYVTYGAAIRKLGEHLGLTLDPLRCYPYRRG
jgi:hypothetical protein